ncbi:Ubiquitin-like protein [Diaporthe australafricana]|uniref:Ubiquitin-like protein ATG12 n=1 Tax=Diaporthe australafricana TaxID=127596 RepID=A0ABR3WP70_9PEZI
MSSPPRNPSSSTAPAAAGEVAAPDVPSDPDPSSRPDSPAADLPLTMTASLVLTQLPRDAAAALAEVGTTFGAQEKVIVRFKPVGGSAPPLPARHERSKVSATSRFETVVAYLRRTLKVAESDSLFLYVNSTFAPALDEVVGNLWRCFKDSNDQLNVGYSMTPAFG